MSNRIVISNEELEKKLADAFKDSMFKNETAPNFALSSHPVNPLTHEELVEKLNLVYKFTNGAGIPGNIYSEFINKYKTGDYVDYHLLIIYKHKLVWKLFYSKTQWFGASYIVDENNNIHLDFKFLNKEKL